MGNAGGQQISRISNILNLISQRQEMTTHNIANMHTPNFAPRHISFAEMLGSPANKFETPLAKKMGGGSGMSLGTPDPTGQGVILQDELMDMQKNSLYYSIATRRLSSLLNSLRTAGQVGR
jgi:flagellar basal-body rod protein FlgB